MSLHSKSHDEVCRTRVVSAHDSGNHSERPLTVRDALY